MRITAIAGAACVILLSISSIASAQNDFKALMSSPTFGGSTQVPEQFKAISHKIQQETQAAEAQTQQVSYAATCDNASCDGNCGHAGCAGAGSGCSTGRCGSGEGAYCIPHRVPNLPNSTLRQYWRSNACNTGLWDDYQNDCGSRGRPKKSRCKSGCNDAAAYSAPAVGCASDAGAGCADPAAGCATGGYPVQESGCAAGGCDATTAAPNVYSPMAGCDGQAGCDVPSYISGGCDTGACDTNGYRF